ncbi:MAG: hypothetical protein BWY89_01248 [Bacteroidetes bacterium ADurb.BinA012]|nr:MAG: hypothetical protein BWY89_01248 [Bacteroidetes bacterium ADurb.BinA012]
MLIFNVTNYLLEDILYGDHPGSAAKLINNKCNALLGIREQPQHPVGGHGLRDDRQLAHISGNVSRPVQYILQLVIPYHVVNVVTIEEYLGVA